MLKNRKSGQEVVRKEFEKCHHWLQRKFLNMLSWMKKEACWSSNEIIQSLLAAFMGKDQSPPVDCLSPIEDLLIKGG